MGAPLSTCTVADLDRDAVPDLVALNQGSDDMSVQLGNADGTCQAAVSDGASSPFEPTRNDLRPGRVRKVIGCVEQELLQIACATNANPSREGGKQCCMEDEGRPLEVGLQGQVSNRLELLGSRAWVVSVEETARHERVRYGPRRRTRVNR